MVQAGSGSSRGSGAAGGGLLPTSPLMSRCLAVLLLLPLLLALSAAQAAHAKPLPLSPPPPGTPPQQDADNFPLTASLLANSAPSPRPPSPPPSPRPPRPPPSPRPPSPPLLPPGMPPPFPFLPCANKRTASDVFPYLLGPAFQEHVPDAAVATYCFYVSALSEDDLAPLIASNSSSSSSTACAAMPINRVQILIRPSCVAEKPVRRATLNDVAVQPVYFNASWGGVPYSVLTFRNLDYGVEQVRAPEGLRLCLRMRVAAADLCGTLGGMCFGDGSSCTYSVLNTNGACCPASTVKVDINVVG